MSLSSNDNKRLQSIDLGETYAYEASKSHKKEKIRCRNVIKQYKND